MNSSKHIGIITFHASHNYGSMLQAYALQKALGYLNYESEVINLRSLIQKEMYLPIHKIKKNQIKFLIKKLLYYPYKTKLNKKSELFELFLKNQLIITQEEYSTLDELSTISQKYNYYISGSDQIWNTDCWDFNWAYFLPFVEGRKKIAYAASMGPTIKSRLPIINDRIKTYISEYDSLSVREKGTQENIEQLSGISPQIVCDPTLLIDTSKWDNIIPQNRLIQGEYLFLYTPQFKEETYKIAKLVGKRLNLKVVISQINSPKIIIFYPNFHKYVATGPIEFLNLCKHAKFICGSSFHLIVFSILFEKPFYSVNGLTDNRIKNLLHNTGLENRSVNIENINKKIDEAFNIDFSKSKSFLKKTREEGISFLISSLSKD